MFTPTAKDDALKNSNFQDNVRDIKEDARQTAHRMGQKVRDFASSASDNLSNAGDTVTQQIRTNPIQASWIALGVGFVLGMMFRR